MSRPRATPELIARCRVGDNAAWAQLYREQQPYVRWTVARIAGPDDADDLVQETFFSVYRCLPDYRAEAAFSTWLTRLARNVAYMALRARACRPQTGDPFPLLACPETDSPESGAYSAELAKAFDATLHEIAPKKRLVFVAQELNDTATERVAVLAGCPARTARTRLLNARRDLAQLVAQHPVLADLASLLAPRIPDRPVLQE